MRNCFPDLAIDVFDVESARKLLLKLLLDKDFYMMVSNKAKEKVEEHHSFSAVKNYMTINLKNMLGIDV